MGSFAPAAATWLARLDLLRNVVRQEVIRRQLATVTGSPGQALDVGAGQGTQAVALAAEGWSVDAADPDPSMRAALRARLDSAPCEIRDRVRVLDIGLEDLLTRHSRRQEATQLRDTYDLVMCHGVLMYLDDPDPAVVALAARTGPAGAVSLVARNAPAMAWRPALRGDWPGVTAMLAELERAAAESRDPRYRNEIGVMARADDVEHLRVLLAREGLPRSRWFGVRVATDGVAVNAPVPDDPADLAALLDAEEALGRTDPYRRLATLFHLVAWRGASAS